MAACGLLFTGTGCVHSQTVSLPETEEPSDPFKDVAYADIIDARYTPGNESRCMTWFTDMGSWYGFTLPMKSDIRHGFCGPFDLAPERRTWISDALVEVDLESVSRDECHGFATTYLPGELRMFYDTPLGPVREKLFFSSCDEAILKVNAPEGSTARFHGRLTVEGGIDCKDNRVRFKTTGREDITLVFPEGVTAEKEGVDAYSVKVPFSTGPVFVRMCFGAEGRKDYYPEILEESASGRWQGYLGSVIRQDTSEEFRRIAAKAVVTLVSNWKSRKGDLKHDGIVPSQSVSYFMGFWGWDSWKHAAAVASFAPGLAKDQVRAMFDYQTPEGMITDCVYKDSEENNLRNSKPPLAAWAVSKIFEKTADKDFVIEMLPGLARYHAWWYRFRDADMNGICEYGSCDGTREAAAWESGMDNAIRFDRTSMVRNGRNDSAWSMDQESVDLNAFLVYDRKCLDELADKVGCVMVHDLPANSEDTDPSGVSEWFYDRSDRFFHDRKLGSVDFIRTSGTEAALPLWTGIASDEQAEAVRERFGDKKKFATFIPFPTSAADDPAFNPEAYWRGPVWLDQAYFCISGLRRYGYTEMADEFTRKLFGNLPGLSGSSPVYENYNSLTGSPLEAPNFSWSAAAILLLYEEYGKNF